MEILNTIAQWIGYGVLIMMGLFLLYFFMVEKKEYVEHEEPIYTESEVKELLEKERKKNIS